MGVLDSLCRQVQQPQGKLARGAVFDLELTEDNDEQLWVPPGLAHGFMMLSDTADFLYKSTDYYAPASQRYILWSDPAIAAKLRILGWRLSCRGGTRAGSNL